MNRPSIFGCFNWFFALLCLALSSCAGIGKPLFSTAAGPQDIGGFNEYQLGALMSSVNLEGFTQKEGGLAELDPVLRETIFTRTISLPIAGGQDCQLELHSGSGEVLNDIYVVFDFDPPSWSRSTQVFNVLSASIRREYDSGWYKGRVNIEANNDNEGKLLWRTLMLNDAQRDNITIYAVEDGLTLMITGNYPIFAPKGS